MTSPSRRAFTAAALGSLLAACGGHQDGSPRTAGPRTAPQTSRSGGAAEPPRSAGRSAPVRLRIPAISVDTPVIRLGLAEDGRVRVPPVTAHDRAGWYRHSPTPGQVGPSVILGHVTVGAYGDGVFRHLGRLRPGDSITVTLENGTAAVFAVRSVRTVAQADFPADDVYGDVDRPELRVITCGGPRTGGHYRDNVIVFAALKSPTP
ncbi:class F sortase [Streptomyces sp. NPDC005551]|uniref:class F sortase n=1 Tax=unclassified Streptomyces TaxID=2593676 RepID=UPI0033F55DC2